MSSSQHPRSRGSDWLALGRAQIRVPIGIAAAYDGPVLGRFARAAAGPVREEEMQVGGVPAIVFRPGRRAGPWPTTVLFPGVTRRGRKHPAFLGIGRGLAAAGHLAIVAEPEGLAAGELTPAAVTRHGRRSRTPCPGRTRLEVASRFSGSRAAVRSPFGLQPIRASRNESRSSSRSLRCATSRRRFESSRRASTGTETRSCRSLLVTSSSS